MVNPSPSPLSQSTVRLPLGILLEDAGLISQGQISVALRDQIYNSHLKLGEILVLRGWILEPTVTFFVEQLPLASQYPSKQVIGYYFKQAHLLTSQQIESILQEQDQTMLRFGALAVLKGYLGQQTVDFFIRHLFPEHRLDSPWTEHYVPYRSGTPIHLQKKTVRRSPPSKPFNSKPSHSKPVNPNIPLIDFYAHLP